MKNWLITAMVLPLAGCVIYSGPYRETHSETVSSDGQTTTRTTTVKASGWHIENTRTENGNAWLAYPTYAKTSDLCDIAIVVLSAERARGEAQPVDYLFWDNDIRTGPDCASEILTTGFPMTTGAPNEVARHMVMPRQLPDDRVYAEVDRDCAKECQSGTGYSVSRRDGHWQVDLAPLATWKR
ncbi:hypothetical protein [Asticcacaulis sp.]|uniref:hypothetical protein n=1 Tax=Asticcacaulis sp. TaxID=1872648 RepID=UPI002B5A723E|nr:hypothetical protein [Asticcacaulis sp.]HTM80880.1 hypothetical protein [Asticcacaulis sp.]